MSEDNYDTAMKSTVESATEELVLLRQSTASLHALSQQTDAQSAELHDYVNRLEQEEAAESDLCAAMEYYHTLCENKTTDFLEEVLRAIWPCKKYQHMAIKLPS